MCMNLYRKINRDLIQFDFVKHSSSAGEFEKEIIDLGGKIFEAPRFKFYNYLQYKNWWLKHLKKHPEHRIIHIHFFTYAGIISDIVHKMNRLTISHAHTSKSDGFLKTLLQRQIERKVDYCFACSREAGHWLYPNRDFSVLNNAIDANIYRYNEAIRSEYRKKFNLDNCLVLGTIANFSSVKNPMGLIDIFKEVKMNNLKTKLLWAGDGTLRKKIEERINAEGLMEDIILLGVRNDIPALLQAMDAFLLPSFYEGLPVVLIEAQGAGLQCFVSDTVTKEVNVTGRCTFINIYEPYQWSIEILNKNLKHIDTFEQIKKAKYDIFETVNWLQEFYFKINKNKII